MTSVVFISSPQGLWAASDTPEWVASFLRTLSGILAVLLLVGLSGCAGQSRAASADESEPTAVATTPEDPYEGRAWVLTPPKNETPSTEPWNHTVVVRGRITVDAVNIGLTGPDRSAQVMVWANVTGIVAELRWTGERNHFDLYVTSPRWCPDSGLSPQSVVCYLQWWATGSSAGSHKSAGQPAGPSGGSLRLEVSAETIQKESCDEKECSWFGVANPRFAVNSDYDLRVTIFTNAPPPEGFTAFR